MSVDDELRNEGKEEQGGFGIQDLSRDALPERVLRRPGAAEMRAFVFARCQHEAHAEVDQISGTGVLDH